MPGDGRCGSSDTRSAERDDDARRSTRSSSDDGRRFGETLPPVGRSDLSFFGGGGDDNDDGPGPLQYTLAVVKPEAAHLMYKIEAVMERNGFVVITKAVFRLTRQQAAEFYGQRLAGDMRLPRLAEHLSSGPIVAYALARYDCVAAWQRLIGPADLPTAKRLFPVSLRAVYGGDAFHGSRSPAAARREIRFFFPNVEIESMETTMNEDAHDDTMRRYIDNAIMPTIAKCLSEMFEINPSDPLRWFGNRLLMEKTSQRLN